MSTLLAAITARRDDLAAQARAILDTAETEQRELTLNERIEHDALLEDLRTIIDRHAELTDQEERRKRAADIPRPGIDGTNVRVGSEPTTYGQGSGHSYFADLVNRQMRGDSAAATRLARYAEETAVEQRTGSRTDGAGGEFVPPRWLINQYAEFARATRATADLLTKFPMPSGTDSIQIPRITTGTLVAPQTADNAAVSSQDLVTTSVTAPVRTLAGQYDVALQLLEQSPAGFDEIVFRDLIADYNRVLESQVLSGTNASGQLQGILGLSGINAVTYTDASPTVPEMYTPIAQGISAVMANRLLPPEAIVINGRRWAWVVGSLDTSNRPFVVPAAQGPNNAAASMNMLNVAGPVGSLASLPVHASMLVPVNLGGGTNEDRIIIGRFSDSFLFESDIRTRVLPDVGSGTLTVRLQVYGYCAVAHRFPASYAVIAGTGCVLPAGY